MRRRADPDRRGRAPSGQPGDGFEGWDRYESAVNTVWQDFPVWGRCLYDTTTTASAGARHRRANAPPHRLPLGRTRGQRRLQGPEGHRRPPVRPDPLEDTPPLAELVNRPAADARHALAQIGRGRLPATTLDDLLIGVSEAVTNAQRHGRPPATVRIWATPRRIVVTVHDTGRGPADHLAGLVPAPSNVSDHRLGLGLWAMHQLRHRRRAQAHRRRLHRQAPQRNDTWLSQVALADRNAWEVHPCGRLETTAFFVLATGPGEASGGAAGNGGAT